MRYLVLSTLLLAGIVPIQGALVSFSFSGTFGTGPFGVIQAGDAFSGTATWDTSSIELSSLSLTFPAAYGLSVSSLTDPNVLWTRVNYTLVPPPPPCKFCFTSPTCTSFPCFTSLQINEKSTVDGDSFNSYVLELGALSGCDPDGKCNADVWDGAFIVFEFANR